MFKKVSVFFGALALLAVASQGFVPSDAAAKNEKGAEKFVKVYVCHKDKNDNFKAVQVSSQASLSTHTVHGDWVVTIEFPCPPAA